MLIVRQQSMMAIQIRSEASAEGARIREVTGLAFRGAAHTCQREHLLVDGLREAGALVVSLVAVADQEIVGHVAVSPVTVSTGTGEWFGIGPISVLPEWQRRGVGSRLMEAALAQLHARGARGCVRVGDPKFYGRFGVRSDPALTVPGVPPEVCLRLRFSESNDHGTATFHAAFAEALAGPTDASKPRPAALDGNSDATAGPASGK